MDDTRRRNLLLASIDAQKERQRRSLESQFKKEAWKITNDKSLKDKAVMSYKQDTSDERKEFIRKKTMVMSPMLQKSRNLADKTLSGLSLPRLSGSSQVRAESSSNLSTSQLNSSTIDRTPIDVYKSAPKRRPTLLPGILEEQISRSATLKETLKNFTVMKVRKDDTSGMEELERNNYRLRFDPSYQV